MARESRRGICLAPVLGQYRATRIRRCLTERKARVFKYERPEFESAAEEPPEILRVGARDQSVENKRVNYTPLKPWQAVRHAERA
jgi:hypothetical protein